jgi:glycosyltransferase involved in cell wall biosynthesis
MGTLKEIGIKANTYRENRNFSGLNVHGYQFRKVIDIYKFPAYFYFRILKKTHPRWLDLFWRPFSKKPRLYHFFNAINRGNQPWIVTTESYLPRGVHEMGKFPSETKYISYGIRRLLHPSCKKIIAISEWAKKMQLEFMHSVPAMRDELMHKIVVWHPPQPLIIRDITEKPVRQALNFIIVGADFFRKGGLEVLLTFDRLLQEDADVNLVIVSSLNYGDYASRTNVADLQNAKSIISKHERIKHFNSLPNKEVLELYRAADICLLPSYEETYGYAVLEAQAAGCPVITTNGAALAEINDEESGWVIKVPLDRWDRSVPRGKTESEAFRNLVQNELYRIIKRILEDRACVREKGRICLERIRTRHNPDVAAERLRELYDAVLK